MELISADEEGCTVRFHRKEYTALMSIAQIARMDFEKLDHAILNLSRDVVCKLENDVYAIASQARSIRKYGK